ncbi:MAG: styrene monooxygenase/indole monooxygenase family protein [Methylocella sp.]
MRKILIVGAGQSGLQLALGLQTLGYDVSLISNRTPDEIRAGRVMSTQCMFHSALQHERNLGINLWESRAPRIEGLGVSVAAQDGGRAIDWVGRLSAYAQSVDQRIKMASWIETFIERRGDFIVHDATASSLDGFARAYDLILVATGKGDLASMFERDPVRSTYDSPQRALAVAYVHGLEPRPEHPDFDAVRFNIVPGAGELFIMPTLTASGRADILFWEVLPGGWLDVFDGIKRPEDHLRVTLELMKQCVPWEYDRARKVELTDANATLVGRFAPTVRRPVGELPSGGLVLGVADVVVANDPITGQGSNAASKCAASYLAAIAERGSLPFDRKWMQTTFERYWDDARHVTKWTNALLGPPPEHVLNLVGSAGQIPAVARRFVDGFDDPSDFEAYFFEPEKTAAWLADASRLAR